MADPRTPTHTTSDDVRLEPERIIAGILYHYGLINCEYPHDWRQDDTHVTAVAAVLRWHNTGVDAARAGERRRNISRILTRAVINERRGYSSAAYALREVAGLIERGEFDDVAAGDE